MFQKFEGLSYSAHNSRTPQMIFSDITQKELPVM